MMQVSELREEEPSNDIAPPVSKKQKTTAAAGKSKKQKPEAAPVKSIKQVDPAIIEQRRDAVYRRVLTLESKLVKDRALLAKYSAPEGCGVEGTGSENDHTANDASELNGCCHD